MHRFTIVPTDPSHQPIEITALDAAAVLPIIDRLGCGEVHVHRNSAYVFSAQPNGNGFWSIFQRKDSAEIPAGSGLPFLPPPTSRWD
ncbi:hypothetical protein WBP07_22180 (plasmid) [Novosphingobium sp. BL-8A]|uniref:hypothetical protein n=1 Tax=Novosphingobium sp. BL-8A TaxID=3127639 RepID=UPI0037577F4D